jgi:hypothetical protein
MGGSHRKCQPTRGARPRTVQPAKSPEPLIVPWQGRQAHIRHDDPHLGPYTPRGAVIRSAIELASDVDGLRLVLASTLGDRYRVRVSDDGSTGGLSRMALPTAARLTFVGGSSLASPWSREQLPPVASAEASPRRALGAVDPWTSTVRVSA